MASLDCGLFFDFISLCLFSVGEHICAEDLFVALIAPYWEMNKTFVASKHSNYF
jgi:hypothetical protein